MRIHRALFHLTAVLMIGLFVASQSAVAAEPLSGYRSAEFGMSAEEVRSRLDHDRIVDTEVYSTDDGDVIIDGRLDDASQPDTDVRYVFPAGRDQLALVLEFHPDSDAQAVQARLEQTHGAPWAEELAERWFEQLKPGMPEGVQGLVVWGGGEINRDRFVRLWVFEDYISVEYLHLGLLTGQ